MKLKLPPVLFVFGLAGAGKTYVGNLIGEYSGATVYDLDQDITYEMRAAIQAKKLFDDTIRDNYFAVVKKRIGELKNLHNPLIVMQAAYAERHRQMLSDAHPEMKFLWVHAPDEAIVARLKGRRDDVTPEYAAQMKSYFEEPVDKALKLLNETSSSRSELISQLKKLFN